MLGRGMDVVAAANLIKYFVLEGLIQSDCQYGVILVRLVQCVNPHIFLFYF